MEARTLEDSPCVFVRRLGVDTGNVRSVFFDWRSPSGPNAHARAIQGVVRDARLIKSCRQPPFGCHRIDVELRDLKPDIGLCDGGGKLRACRTCVGNGDPGRSEEHTSELQSLMRLSYAVFCLKTKSNYAIYIQHTQP